MARIYGVCYTLFDYTQEQVLSIQGMVGKMGTSYICFGREICPTTGNPHLQGYLNEV
jgi:hypothetical protein